MGASKKWDSIKGASKRKRLPVGIEEGSRFGPVRLAAQWEWQLDYAGRSKMGQKRVRK